MKHSIDAVLKTLSGTPMLLLFCEFWVCQVFVITESGFLVTSDNLLSFHYAMEFIGQSKPRISLFAPPILSFAEPILFLPRDAAKNNFTLWLED